MAKKRTAGTRKSAESRSDARSGDVCSATAFWARSCGCRVLSVKKGDRFPPCPQRGGSVEFSQTENTDPTT
jgi:hypothetical protein